VSLKDWAVSQGISYATARRWYGAGKLPVPACQAGRLIVIGEPSPPHGAGITAVYARVSSADQKPDLDRQVAR
jgi:predicted site-specific integrase-resolvase